MAVKHKDLKKVVSELEGAVKAHGRQAKTIKQHIKDMSGPFKMNASPFHKSKGLWANIVNGNNSNNSFFIYLFFLPGL